MISIKLMEWYTQLKLYSERIDLRLKNSISKTILL